MTTATQTTAERQASKVQAAKANAQRRTDEAAEARRRILCVVLEPGTEKFLGVAVLRPRGEDDE
jgi:hypothetical protein